jgi:aspartyl-tRNA(Asn)/glutamyl-tRNA(Gln) amidotransferase subunit A
MTPANLLSAAEAIRSGATSATTLVQAALERIKQCLDLNTIAFLDADGALADAQVLDEEAERGHFRGPLHGVPVTVKDLFNVRGMPMKAGTNAPLPPITPDEAVAVTRLCEAGAVIVAKTNMQEIALGLNGENPWTGDVKNPHDPARQAGGSSSGSAAAVAAGIGYGSLGSDTAGSIRLPASFCGVVGFKPSYGVVPLDGALALIPSCDHAGPIARTVADARMMFRVLSDRPHPQPLPVGEGGLVLAIPRAYLDGALTPEVRAAFEMFLTKMRDAGATVKDVALDIGDAAEAFLPLRAESVLIHRRTLESQPDVFAPYVREALLRGYDVSAVHYLDAKQRQFAMREAIHRAMAEAHADAMLMPAAPCVAPPRGVSEITLESGAKNLRLAILHLTAPAAFAGVPALSLPFAWLDGLPVGLQVITPFGSDERALAVGAWIEKVTSSE